ncbi:hypothetical protein [Oxobacter pfennigii]|uniref:hypothetical protein n=1 Tax=Oxobacter pfennigii TaxID=36849 RepID=UPI0006D455FA|nr:hypothetical protein [Oxobacter pfennigii]
MKDNTYHKLLFYNHKDWSITRGETEYKLALAYNDGKEVKTWVLPYEKCLEVRKWAGEYR